MILGIGTDITQIKRIESIVRKHGDRFIKRCFSPSENSYINLKAKNNDKALYSSYAKRWAAKEACAKALGIGITNNVFLKDIIVTNNKNSKPEITLKNGAKEYLDKITPENHKIKIDLSLSDDYPLAIAFVIISAEEE